MQRFVWDVMTGAVALAILPVPGIEAQTPTLGELRAKIFDATMLKQTFVNGLHYCNEFDGTNFYFEPRNRVLNLEEYHRSLESLVRQGIFNPEKHKPWSERDAADRWEEVKKEAAKDKANCDLVASLPALQKEVDELETKTDASDGKTDISGGKLPDKSH